MKIFKTLIIVFILIGIFILLINLSSDENKESDELIINYSEISQEFDLENLTYKAVDYEASEITGKSYYGVDGTFTTGKPIIKGTSWYGYWLKNNSYYIEPSELKIDPTHKNQFIIAKAYKKVNLSNDVKFIDKKHYQYNKISFFKKDEYYDMAIFKIIYQAKKRTRFPFGAVIVFEYDKQIDEFICGDINERMVPYFYTLSNLTNRADAFEIERDMGNWEVIEMECYIEKFSEKELNNNKIKMTILPNDFYLTDWEFIEEYELELGVEDYLMNPLNKPIFEGEILIK